MKKKGFTLVEILAVVVILGLLAIIVMPNVLDMFKEAKKRTFESELKEIYRVAQQKWVSDSKDDMKIFANTKHGNCGSQLDLSGRNNINYYIQMDSKGNVILYYASDGTYQYKYMGTGLRISEIEDTLEISKVTSDNKIDVSCDVISGTDYFTSAPHKIKNSSRLLNNGIKLYPTSSEVVSNTDNRFFLKYTLDSYKEDVVQVFYCAKISDGYDSCISDGIAYDTMNECNDILEQMKSGDPNASRLTFSCYEKTSTESSGFITGKILGFEKDGRYYYLDRKEGFEANKTKLYGVFGSNNCEIGCLNYGNGVNDQTSDVMNITPSKMSEELESCTDPAIICVDDEIGVYYSKYETYIENKDGNYFSRYYRTHIGDANLNQSPLKMGANDGNYPVVRMKQAISFPEIYHRLPSQINGPAYFCTENAEYSGCGYITGCGEHHFE